MNLVDTTAAPLRFAFSLFARPATYVPGSGASASLLAFIRGVRSDDLFASAMQQDVAAVINAAEFKTLFPARPIPARYDRLRTATMSYAVEEWRGAPNDDMPTFFKLLLRGGSQ
jgi:hypothetical protein